MLGHLTQLTTWFNQNTMLDLRVHNSMLAVLVQQLDRHLASIVVEVLIGLVLISCFVVLAEF